MLEHRRKERIARAPAGESGSDPETPTKTTLSVTEWLQQMNSKGVADAPPAAPKGSKEKRAFTEYMGNLALATVQGEHKPLARGDFEAGIRKFATSRTRMSGKMAMLAGLQEIDARDRAVYMQAITKIDGKLSTLGVASEDTADTSLASVQEAVQKSDVEDSGVDRISEEELLRGLQGLAPKEDAGETSGAADSTADPAEGGNAEEGGEIDVAAVLEKLKKIGRNEPVAGLPDGWEERLVREKDGSVARVATNGKDTLRRIATDKDRERLAHTLPDIKTDEMSAPAPLELPKTHVDEPAEPAEPAETDDDIVEARSRRMAAARIRRKQEKKQLRAEGKEKEALEAREARLVDRMQKFFERFERGADPTLMYQLIENTLPRGDIEEFKTRLERQKVHINGATGKEIPDLAMLASNEEEARELFGEEDGRVGEIPFWLLPDERAVILDFFRDQRVLRTLPPGGTHHFGPPEGWHVFENKKFRKMTEAEVQQLIARRKSAAKSTGTIPRNEPARPRVGTPAEQAPQAARAAAPAEQPRRAEPVQRQGQEGRARDGSSEQPRTLEEAKRVFFRAHNKERKKAGKAFREAARGLSEKNRRRLIDFLVDTTDIHREVLETIHRDFERENKERNDKGERVGTSRLEREIQEDIARIGSGRSSQGMPRERAGRKESEAERIAREIDEDIAAILKK